jgi:molecular chaperone GrpE
MAPEAAGFRADVRISLTPNAGDEMRCSVMTEENKDIQDNNAEAASVRDGKDGLAERAETKANAEKTEGQTGAAKSEGGGEETGKGEKAKGGDDAAALAERVARLETENAELRDKLLRTMAEMENVRRRTEREKADISKYAITKFAGDVVGVADNIRRAIEATPKKAASSDPALKSLVEGVEVTERELTNVLERHGIKRLDPLHEKFDPNFHQAMFEEESLDTAAGNVVRVMQAGFMIEDRLLRPALVSVAKAWTGPKPEPKPEPKPSVEETPGKTERNDKTERANRTERPDKAERSAEQPKEVEVSPGAASVREPKAQNFGTVRPEWTAPRAARPNPSRPTINETRRPSEGTARPRISTDSSPFSSAQRPPQPPANGGAPTARTSTLHQPVIGARTGPRKGNGQ